MDHRDYVAHDALGLAALVAAGEVSAGEVLDAAVAAIDARNPEINAVVSRRDDAARAEVAAGLPAGPLTGVPYLVKDLNAHVAGLPSTQGVRLFADVVAAADSEFVARLRRAGIQVNLHYQAVPQFQFYRNRCQRPYLSCPVAARFAKKEISLPIFPGLEPAEQARVVREIKKCIP